MSLLHCEISGETFVVSDAEISLRAKFGFGDSLPSVKPRYRFRELGAFWPHWNLHSRKCDRTGKDIISIFRPDCPYPVWNRSEWIEHADPPSREFDFSRPFFEQAWELFQHCPLPHNFQSQNQNCEYTDDFYESKNCYLCHSGENNEDLRYCLYPEHVESSYYSVRAMNSELCCDVVNSDRCYNLIYGLQCKNVSDSAFVYDCRNCSNCLFSYNLRNKNYCVANEQLSEADFLQRKAEWRFSSHEAYQRAKNQFHEMMRTQAFHRAVFIDKSESTTGNYLVHCNRSENCFMLTYHEDCINDAVSGPHARSTLDSMGTIGSELSFYSVMDVFCYESKFCFDIAHCRFCTYCSYCFHCEYCFGCCGLVRKKYHIFNRPCSPEEYEALVQRIVEKMKQTKEWGEFFPGHFAPNPYDESWSGYHFALSTAEQNELGFRTAQPLLREKSSYRSVEEIPDDWSLASSEAADQALSKLEFWDSEYQRPFRISEADISFCRKMGVPLPRTYYMNRIQENYNWMPFDGELRLTTCRKCGKPIETSWPQTYDKRILCEEHYLQNLV